MVQQEPPFPPEMSPTSPLLSPQKSTSQTPLLQQAPPPGYQSPDTKSWQQTGITSNRLEMSRVIYTLTCTFTCTLTLVCLTLWCSLFSQSGQGAGQAFGQQGVYNNMSITVSMAGGSSGVSSLPPMGQPVAMSNSNLNNVSSVCSDQQVGDVGGLCRVQIHFYFSLLEVCSDEFPFLFFPLLPAGAGVCRCPMHSEPGGERLLHQPGLRRSCGLTEGPWSTGLSEQPGPAEEPSPAAAHRVTPTLLFLPPRPSLLQLLTSQHLLGARCRPHPPPHPAAVSVSPFQTDGRWEAAARVGSDRFGCQCYTSLFGGGGGRGVLGRVFHSPLLKKSDLCQKEQQCVGACLSDLSDNLSVCLSLLKAGLSCCSFLGELLPDLRKQQLQRHL